MTIGTGKFRYLSEPLNAGDELVGFHLLLGNSRLNFNIIRHWIPSFLFDALVREPGQKRGNLAQWQGVINFDFLHHAHWHAGEGGFKRILDDRKTATMFHGAHSDFAIVARAGKYHS